ncbi:hypothetical protein WJX74_001349 [Apatococcus lobatus]|uniref:Tetratricopeptide repeat protein 1 n=2 Tax=Apatococcus TaxID=904362 RepID=A0AAW1SYE5_9CHLO
MAHSQERHPPIEADEPESPSSTSTSDVFHDTASQSGRDIHDPLSGEQDSFFDAQDTTEEADTTEHGSQHQRETRKLGPSPSEQEPRAAESSTDTREASTVPPAAEPEIEEFSAAEALTLPSPEERKEAAEGHKKKGNELFAAEHFAAASDEYTQALDVAHEDEPSRAVYFANRAACRLKLKQLEEAAQDCTSATNIDQSYLKAWIRRSTAYEQLNQYERALGDAKKVAELDPSNQNAQQNVQRLTPLAQQEQEKMKEEMIGKLKDLGNTVLGKFGMSLDNFKAVKDPNTGSYSINFNQG